MEDNSYVSLSLEKYNELYNKAKQNDERMEFNDETGYILITEIIKAHIAEHNQDKEVMERCQQALLILDMLKQ